MSTSQLGWAEDLDKYWSEELTNQLEDHIQIKSVHRRHIRSLPELSNYPYEGQLCLSGSFSFGIPARKGGRIPKNGQYEYRTGSGLFLLNTPTDRPTAQEVFSAINKRVSSDAEIKNALSLDRGALWQFLEKAKTIDKLVVRGPEGTYDAVVLANLLRHNAPRQALDEAIGFREEVNLDSLEATLETIEIPDQLDDIRNLNIDWYSTAIDHAIATFWYRGEHVTFEFNRGALKVKTSRDSLNLERSDSPEEDDPKEYVLQLFESEVVFPSTS